nr:helix-turn-helix transcriptional regulator [Pseudomaricurvus alkylphenolicus]
MNVSGQAQLASLSLTFKTEWLLNLLGSQTCEALSPLLAAGEAQKAASHVVAIDVNAAIYRVARELLDLPTEDPFCVLLAQAKAKELLFVALQALASGNQSPDLRFREQEITQLNAVKQRLESEYASALTLEELSRWAGLNRRKLTEGFKALYGATVNEYLLLQRMSQAGSLLRQGMPVAQVAERVGYLDRGSFSKVFKRHFGVTPKEY